LLTLYFPAMVVSMLERFHEPSDLPVTVTVGLGFDSSPHDVTNVYTYTRVTLDADPPTTASAGAAVGAGTPSSR
jgi:hypothetical protein